MACSIPVRLSPLLRHTLAAALLLSICLAAGSAWADGELDGMAAIVSGKAKVALDGDTLGKQKVFAMLAFDAGVWGARDSAGTELVGFYASRGGSSKRHDLDLAPQIAASLENTLANMVGPEVVRRFGPLPDGVLRIVRVDARTRAKKGFRTIKAVLSVRFAIESSRLRAPLTGKYKVALAGPMVGGRAAGGRVIVNGETLDRGEKRLLERRGVRALPGRYWYDERSGLWGLEEGPSLGMLPAELDLPDDLDEDASGGRTKVELNGRILHPVELQFLKSRFGRIEAGRYFLNADGTAGRVGERASLNLRGGGGGGGSRSVLGHSLTGSVIGGGGVVGFVDGGTGVTCGPDGGCIF